MKEIFDELKERARALTTRAETAEATLQAVTDEINKLWSHICHGKSLPVDSKELLVKRVKWIGAQLDCAETNFAATNSSYVKALTEIRELQERAKMRPVAWLIETPNGSFMTAARLDGWNVEVVMLDKVEEV